MTEKKICGLLIAETVKALQSTNAEMQLILLPLEVIAVSGHGERQYVALLPAGRGNAFSALKNPRADFKTTCCTSIAVQESEFVYHMLCKKPQMNLLRCSKNFFLSKKNLVVNKSGTIQTGCTLLPKLFPLPPWERSKRELKSMPTCQPVLEYCCSIQYSALTTISALPLLPFSAVCRNRPLLILWYWGMKQILVIMCCFDTYNL